MLLQFSFLLPLASVAAASVLPISQNTTLICELIASQISGDVYYPLSLSANFATDTEHYFTSSSQTPTCVVEAADTADVSTVLKIVGVTKTPFAVRSGGHASNPGFSSTPGVHISLVRFSDVVLSGNKKTVEIGTGKVWADVYSTLEGSGVNVGGGRVPGPAAGLTLGGGYSWKTNQYGLTCDNIVSYTLVLPNSTIKAITSSQPDLFFALKGGLNRFGIVTSITYQTHPQPALVYGGIQYYTGAPALAALINATETFYATNTDAKAQVILTIDGGVVPSAILILFYDGPTRPAAFNPYNGIPGVVLDTLATQTFSSFVAAIPAKAAAGARGAFATFSTSGLTTNFMNAVYNESIFYGALAVLHTGVSVGYDIEPFLKFGKYATDSAFPHANSPLPLNLDYGWALATEDAYWTGMMRQSVNTLIGVAKKEGIYVEGMYPNYALSGVSGDTIYGATNAVRLRAIQKSVDKQGVMELAGGFSF